MADKRERARELQSTGTVVAKAARYTMTCAVLPRLYVVIVAPTAFSCKRVGWFNQATSDSSAAQAKLPGLAPVVWGHHRLLLASA